MLKHQVYRNLFQSLPTVHRASGGTFSKGSGCSNTSHFMRLQTSSPDSYRVCWWWWCYKCPLLSMIRHSRFSKRSICKVLLSLNLLSLLGLTCFYKVTTHKNYFRILGKDMQHLAKHLHHEKCNFPTLKPFSEDILPLLSRPSPLNCAHKANPLGEVVFVQERGTRVLKRVGSMENIDGCCYRPFHRMDDDRSESENLCVKIIGDETKIPEEYEFVEVICVGGREDYRDGFAFVDKKPEVEEWMANVEAAMEGQKDRISVVILGLDATSHMNFLRTLPESNKFLLNNLSAIAMNGYTKVGENTLPNVVPLLTGLTLEEFKETCVDPSVPSSEVHLDSCPFIWKTFATKAFRTGLAEDDVDIGIFNMYWKHAFDKPPTHYYLRPFSKLMQKTHSSGDEFCYGTRLSFKVLLDNLEHIAVALKDTLYFHFTWSTKLPHNNFNKLALGDAPLLKFLHFMKTSHHLDKTVLIVMSDHGSRLDGIRKTPQGKLEDRMPLLYIVLPPWFSSRYPTAYKNLESNSNKLTSPFDMHKTLQDFMDLSRLDDLKDEPDFSAFHREQFLGSQPHSLFDNIPENRTCFDAGVPLHWCVCRGGKGGGGEGQRVDLQSEDVLDAVHFSIQSMNYHLRGQSLCANLQLNKVADAFYINAEGDEGEASGDRMVVLRVSFVTVPGHGMFEATLLKDESMGGRWMLTEQVVRTNSYGGQSKCVEQEFKEFCYCDDLAN